MKKVDQATIIILDVGKNTSNVEEKNSKTFFDDAAECTKRIIERKIMSQGKDLLGIILLGAKKTKNNMAHLCPGTFKNIELFTELEVPSWKMIRELPNTPTNTSGDWFDSLIVAADYFKNGVSGIKCSNRRIILMTNFKKQSSIDEDSFAQALQGFIAEDFQVDVIGFDIYLESFKNNDINYVRKFVECTNGVNAKFDETMRYLAFHKRKHVYALPWNVDLCIGPNIKIPVSSYLRIKNEPIVKKWTKAVQDPVTGMASSTEAIGINRVYLHSETKTVLNAENVLKGVYYGGEIVPFNLHDKTLLYESGPKSLMVYGFTESCKVQWQNLNGDGLSYVFGRKGDSKAQYAVKCLVGCLKELNLVGIVRRVYNNGNAPKMFVLMPVIDTSGYFCLSMASICFKDEIKYMSFPQTKLPMFTFTKDQVDTFKDLIKSMDLKNAYDADEFDAREAFPVGETICPSAQYVLDCIAFRAMNPGKPLPPPRKDIMMLFKVPPLLEKRSSDIVKKLKSLFILNKVEVKHRNMKLDEPATVDSVESTADQTLNTDKPKVDLFVHGRLNKIQKIGTVKPIEDYKFLQDSGKLISDLASEIINAIECLMHSNLDEHCLKALEAMEFFRAESVKGDPTYYNNWIKNFKLELYDRKRNEVVEIIKERNLNVIKKNENNLSNFDLADEDDSQIYEMNTVPTFTQMEDDTEVKNFFNDM